MSAEALPSPTEEWDESLLSHREFELGSLRIHAVEAGQGPLVILLHGFPEFWFSWRHQISALVDAGYRVVAPDLRGYNRSDKPDRVADYRVDVLAEDVARIIELCGEPAASVIGHDWGAHIAWIFAMTYPERLRRLGILNVPHPARLMRGLWSPRQLLRSWYIFFFQLPFLPERLFRAKNFAGLRRIMRREPQRPGTFSEEDISRYIEAHSQPGALTAMLNYYRAAIREGPWANRHRLRIIEQPVCVIWGLEDRHLGAEMAVPDAHWVPKLSYHPIPGASHWVQCDRPDQVNPILLDFLAPELNDEE